MAMKILKENPNIANNPNAQSMINVIQSGDEKKGQEIAENICKSMGVSKEDAIRQAEQSITFDKVLLKTGCAECHRENTGSVKMRANGIYEVSFAGNISGAVAGTPVQLAFQLGGVTLPETTMVSTPGAANASNNVATSTLIKNCCGDYDRITVTNNGTADVTVAANSAFIVRRLA
jgi:hypothetical protein